MNEPDTRFKVQGGKVVRDVPRLEAGVVDALRAFPTSIISDCLERLNVPDPGLRPLLVEAKSFSGSAFTVEEIEAGNLMSHLALTLVQAGDVLVIDAKGVTSRACWGGLQTFAAQRKGVRAIVIDGAIRDLDDVQRFGVPVYARAVTPAGPHKGWGGRVNQPIACGGVVVHPGDVIVGDGDGLVVVPRERASKVAAAAAAKVEQEQAWFAAVEAGRDTADFLGLSETAKKYGVEFV